jgi:hypothetical protein
MISHASQASVQLGQVIITIIYPRMNHRIPCIIILSIIQSFTPLSSPPLFERAIERRNVKEACIKDHRAFMSKLVDAVAVLRMMDGMDDVDAFAK